MAEPLYIWIVRWHEFQTYQKKRGKPWAPPWLMDHTRQLDDDRYLDLTAAERGLLHDLRLEFARTRLDLRSDTTRLSRRLGYKVYTSQLERLNDAGFIVLCSRTVLEQFRNAFWNGSSLEVEEEREQPEPAPEPEANYAGAGAGADDDIDFGEDPADPWHGKDLDRLDPAAALRAAGGGNP